MKESCAVFISELAPKLKKEIGDHAKSIMDSLCQNTKHQRFKIRKLSIRAIGDISKTDHAAPLLKDILVQLKPVLNDIIPDVRKELYLVVKDWLESFDVESLKLFESDLALLLLAGLGDENEEIAKLCVKALEEHGSKVQASSNAKVDPHSFDEKFKRKISEQS